MNLISPQKAKEEKSISYKSLRDIEKIRVLGRHISKFFDSIESILKPNLSLKDIDLECKNYIKKNNLESGMLGYRGFKSYISCSLNSTAAHGLPSETRLKAGDMLSLDTIFKKESYFVDSAKTFLIGNPNEQDKYLYRSSKEVFLKTINGIRVGDRISRIGELIQRESALRNINVFYEFSSHGTGFKQHEYPTIKHIKNNDKAMIENGLVFTIEPIFTLGINSSYIKEDMSYVSIDSKKTCQFEHTLAAIDGRIHILST